MQGDLKHEDYASKTLRNPARYKVPHLGYVNHLYNLGDDRLSSSPAEKEILLDTAVNKNHE